MFQEKLLNSNQIPIDQKNRKCTDIICSVIGASLAITLFVVACTMWNRNQFENRFFNGPLQVNGEPCPEKTYAHIQDPHFINTTTCVKNCPANHYVHQNLCLPTVEQSLDLYLSNPEITSPLQYSQFKWVLFYTAVITLSIGLIWSVFVQALPRYASIVGHLLATGSLIAFGVVILVLADEFFSKYLWIKITVSVICFLLAVTFLVMLFLYSNQVKFQGLFLDYSSLFLASKPATLIYLPIYLLFFVGLVALIVWQHCCFTTKFAESRDFFNFINTGVWQILNIIQFIWGAQFLRDSYNFCLSGQSTDFYWRKSSKCSSSYTKLLRYHWGSVVGGSFLNAFFEIPTLLVELIVCHPEACCSQLGVTCTNVFGFLTCFFDLIRTDSYGYIHLSSIPFCNAARECKKICQNSKHFVGTYSPIKHYRLVVHTFIVSLGLLVGWLLLRQSYHNYSFWNIILLIVVSYISSTLFIDLHADSAQGLQTSYLAEHHLQPNHQLLKYLNNQYRTELGQWERREKGDGRL